MKTLLNSRLTRNPQLLQADRLDLWITEIEAAQITGMSVAWFQRMRWAGGGMPYTKLGRACRYKLSDVMEWMDSRKRISTSNTGED
jgi:predicted DNA-binding transcriptional regulator AlpA